MGWLSVLVVLGWLALTANGWWDEGHMLLAAVAREELDPSDVKVLESVLSLWDAEYPGMSSLPVAAVWADHIKCTHDAPYCRGLRALDSIELFNDWHYAPYPYNPENIELPPWAEYVPQFRGADITLAKLYESLSGNVSAAAQNLFPFDRVNRHIGKEGQRSHSLLGWNLQLRLFVHIFGDLHQPLHATDGYFSFIPLGDRGATTIHVHSDPPFPHLHGVWDGCGGECMDPWPDATEDHVLHRARQLRERYPKESFGDRVQHSLAGGNFTAIALDSHRLARTVYSEYLSGPHLKRKPYQPSDEYMAEVREVALRQIALGGYRLANALQYCVNEAKQFLQEHAGVYQYGDMRRGVSAVVKNGKGSAVQDGGEERSGSLQMYDSALRDRSDYDAPPPPFSRPPNEDTADDLSHDFDAIAKVLGVKRVGVEKRRTAEDASLAPPVGQNDLDSQIEVQSAKDLQAVRQWLTVLSVLLATSAAFNCVALAAHVKSLERRKENASPLASSSLHMESFGSRDSRREPNLKASSWPAPSSLVCHRCIAGHLYHSSPLSAALAPPPPYTALDEPCV